MKTKKEYTLGWDGMELGNQYTLGLDGMEISKKIITGSSAL